MDIMDKAKELGQMIASSEQYTRLIQAEIAQTNDEDAQKLLKHYNARRIEIARKMKKEQSGPEELEQYRTELQQEFDLLVENENVKEYIEAKKAFEQLMKSVNSVIAFYVTGEEQSGCSPDKCSGCSGCQ